MICSLHIPVIRFPLKGLDPRLAIESQERLNSPEGGRVFVEEVDLNIGHYFPCIAKPLFLHGDDLFLPDSEDDVELAKSIWRETSVVTQDLEQCFNVNAITERNFSAFGPRYEQIIYFCCIGIESLFRRIIEASGELNRSLLKKKYSMNDFIRLRSLLRIDEVGLNLVRYPWISEIKPFEGWSDSAPSESLSWFGAYNALKHDKRRNDQQASMKNAIAAAAAYYSLAHSTLGTEFFPGFIGTEYYFHFASRPRWRTRDRYFKPKDGNWKAVPIS